MLLEEAHMSRGSYLYQLRKAPSKCLDAVYSEQIAAIRKIHSDSKERYGYRRVMYALRNQGMHLNHKTVHKLMHHLRLQGAHPKVYKKFVATNCQYFLKYRSTSLYFRLFFLK